MKERYINLMVVSDISIRQLAILKTKSAYEQPMN